MNVQSGPGCFRGFIVAFFRRCGFEHFLVIGFTASRRRPPPWPGRLAGAGMGEAYKGTTVLFRVAAPLCGTGVGVGYS